MSVERDYRYFYGDEADEFVFIRVPKIMFRDPVLKKLSSDAKILYGMMLDRQQLSLKNRWLDEEGRVYICFTVENVIEELGCGRNKALGSMKELEGVGLIERKRLGLGKNSIIYIKKFISVKTEEDAFQKFKNQTSGKNEADPEVSKLNFKKFENQTSRGLKNKLQEVCFSNPNNTNNNNTEYSNIKSNLIYQDPEEERSDKDEIRWDAKQSGYQKGIEDIKERIRYRDLCITRPDDIKLLDEIVEILAEIEFCRNDTVSISRGIYSGSFVRERFRMIEDEHIDYVIDCFKGNTTKVKNIKKYLMAALFNAPATKSGYYRAEVNHDMPWLAQ